MIQNFEYWTAKIRELRLKMIKTEDPSLLASYQELIDDYQKLLSTGDKLGTDAALNPEH